MKNIRNFSIIAHIDHGKTTLTDRFLEITGLLTGRNKTERVMDSNPIEQERGITIKLAPVRMEYQDHILNLIDTPGHVDFGYEVSRSLIACEGALLLIDASQGVQAQTLSHFETASKLGLKIIPIINKIDLPASDPDGVMLECMEIFGFDEQDFILVSAKTGENAEQVLRAVIDRIPAPTGKRDASLRALVITSKFDHHKGVIAYVRVVDGKLGTNKLKMLSTQSEFNPIEVGVFTPSMQKKESLAAGEVGYVATGLKDIKQIRVGDTVTNKKESSKITPLPGYKEPTPMVYMELYPIDADEFTQLKESMEKLSLHDASLQYTGTHSEALGNGLRVGFLGILHAEIIRERLLREFELDLIATAPSVTYQLTTNAGQEKLVRTSAEMPDPSTIAELREPMTRATIFTPEKYYGQILQIIRERRGQLLNVSPVGTRSKLECELPLAEIIIDLHDTLKSISSGYASLEYELSGFRKVDAVKVLILLNKEPVEALSFITIRDLAMRRGKSLVKKLKEVIPRQMFEVPIQAAIGGKIIARETLQAYRKDVTAKLYGGDITRRQKLLKKQAKGKKKMKQIGRVELNQEAFLAVLERD